MYENATAEAIDAWKLGLITRQELSELLAEISREDDSPND